MTEQERMAESGALHLANEEAGPWYQWGPYVSERAWGTVREDYSADGDAWTYFPYEHSRSRAYRWSEDGIGAICDSNQDMCLGLALWNGRDPHLKERMFGLTGPQGNHGEDVKEYWWYLDATPSHSWLKMRYHYPQGEFPYDDLVATNAARTRHDPEYELLDTGIFNDDRYWVVDISYAKKSPTEILMRVQVTNAGPDRASIHVLPTAWFRNTWSWGSDHIAPQFALDGGTIVADHPRLGDYHLDAAPSPNGQMPTPLFCNNETNAPRVFGSDAETLTDYPKDGINDHIVGGAPTVNPSGQGTKAAWSYVLDVAPGETQEIRLRLWSPGSSQGSHRDWSGEPFEALMAQREHECVEFYQEVVAREIPADQFEVMRRAFAGMIWGKQFYRYDVRRWLNGDPNQPPPPPEHLTIRNAHWRTMDAHDVMSMPDPWEYPWFATWDFAFHSVVFAHIDPEFAKYQILLLLREWYMHPNGALPAYEWNFDDVNPPVHAWAAIRVFEIDGAKDFDFLGRVFQKLLMNFTWWVNRVDPEGNNVFEGGFLGLDNIGPIDRSHLPKGYHLDQVDGTAWMASYSLMMLRMAMRLAREHSEYGPMVLKFLEHFAEICDGMAGSEMFDAEDGFFYDQLLGPDGSQQAIKVRSLVGVIPVLAAAYLDLDESVKSAERSQRRFADFMRRRGIDSDDVNSSGFIQIRKDDQGVSRALLTVADPDRLRRVLMEVLSEDSLLSPYGLRSMSKRHQQDPYSITVDGKVFQVDYEPAESQTAIYGGNSNWRGPVWFPINHLVIEALERFHMYFGDDYKVECPTGSGVRMNLQEVADELRRRLISLFIPDPTGWRAEFGGSDRFGKDPRWKEPLFYEYFNGDDGAGLGASHQTGWTGLVADLIIGRRG